MSTVHHALGFKTDDLPINQLYALDSALRTIADVVGALREQPRLSESGNGDGGYNEAGWLLDDFRDRIGQEIEAIGIIAEARPTSAKEEYDRKFSLLARGYLSGADRPEWIVAELARIAKEMGDRP